MRRKATALFATLSLAAICGCENPQPQEEPVQEPAAYSDAMEPDYYATHALDEPPADEPAEPAAVTEPAPPPPTEPPAAKTHVVVKDDTFYSLARKYYDDQSRWKDIYEANRDAVSGPDKLRVGQELVIP